MPEAAARSFTAGAVGGGHHLRRRSLTLAAWRDGCPGVTTGSEGQRSECADQSEERASGANERSAEAARRNAGTALLRTTLGRVKRRSEEERRTQCTAPHGRGPRRAPCEKGGALPYQCCAWSSPAPSVTGHLSFQSAKRLTLWLAHLKARSLSASEHSSRSVHPGSEHGEAAGVASNDVAHRLTSA